MGNPTILFPTSFDTNRSAQSQKQARTFGYKKKSDCTIYGAKTKALISCAVTGFSFSYLSAQLSWMNPCHYSKLGCLSQLDEVKKPLCF